MKLIEGDTIIFNSDWNNYEDEENGKKPNTQRLLSRADVEEVEIWWKTRSAPRKIEMHDNTTRVGLLNPRIFKRTLTDVRSVGELLGKFMFVFSWSHKS